MKFLLDKSLEHLDTASRERSAGNWSHARWHYLKSAEYLFKAAETSRGKLREIRINKAEQMARIARQLGSAHHGQHSPAAEAVAVQDGNNAFLMRESANVRFQDVAGLEDAKAEIRLRLIYPLIYPEKAERYGIKCGGGVLLYGPPGTGKTLLARAVAGEVDAAFLTAKPSELMSKWVGEAEQNIARLFDTARQHERTVIFIDEVEAMIPARRSSNSTVMQRVVPQILTELQGVKDQGSRLLFLAATNEPWAIDPAALRPGRFDAKVFVGLPCANSRRQMLALYLATRPVMADLDLDQLAEQLEGYSGADIAEICQRCAARVFIESVQRGTDRDIASDDVQAVLSAMTPSISSKQAEKYERWLQN